MSQFVEQFSFQIPAGTPQASPVDHSVAVDNMVVERIELEVPNGPAGTMGFAVYNSGSQWKPDTTGAWLVWDGYTEGWWLSGQPTGGNWSIRGYNTGFYAHTVYTRWFLNPPTPTPPPDFGTEFTFVTTGVAPGETVVL